jgi:hypothetical protein
MRVRPYNIPAHRETLNGKPAVIGFALIRAGKRVRTWNFEVLKRGSVVEFSHGGFRFRIRITMVRYGFGRRAKSGFTMVKMANIKAFKGTKQVKPPRWFFCVH